MAKITKIWQRYVFGRLDENGEIEYFTPTNGYLVYKVTINGKTATKRILNPTESQMNEAGWYRVVNVAEDGTDYINDNILYHYTGVVTDEPIEEEEGE